MRSFLHFVGAVLVAATVFACKKADPLQDPIPPDPLVFRSYLIERIPGALKSTVCKCCGKSLHQCFDETLNKQAGPKCPDT